MSFSGMISKVGGAFAVVGVLVGVLFGVGSAAASTTGCVDALLEYPHYCTDGHPWHN
jgi:hypothetical protein